MARGCGCCYRIERGHKDFVRGGVGVNDFEEEVRHRHPPRKKKVNKPKARGCPENDYGPHVYVWVPRVYQYDWWPEYGLDSSSRYETKTCCGCGKTNGSRYTEQFAKRVARLGWYKANYGNR